VEPGLCSSNRITIPSPSACIGQQEHSTKGGLSFLPSDMGGVSTLAQPSYVSATFCVVGGLSADTLSTALTLSFDDRVSPVLTFVLW
jgi:hypothetical protein